MPVIVTCTSCGSAVRRSPSAVRPHNFCDQACCTGWKKTRTREFAGGWRTGTRTSSHGRVKIKLDSHPRADSIGYVYRYHLVAEQMLGRPLEPEEVVHHKDFDPTNDEPSNLYVFPNEAEHQRFHGKLRGGINGK